MTDTEINLTGNVVREPLLEKASSGAIFTRNSIAMDTQRPDGNGGWVRGETTYMDISLFGSDAEHFVASCVKGTRIMAVGRLQQRTVENDEGQKRSFYSVVCSEVAVSLKWVTVGDITKRAGKGAVKLKLKPSKAGAKASTSTKKSKKSKKATKAAIEAPF